MAMCDWLHKYPQVQALLQRGDDELLYDVGENPPEQPAEGSTFIAMLLRAAAVPRQYDPHFARPEAKRGTFLDLSPLRRSHAPDVHAEDAEALEAVCVRLDAEIAPVLTAINTKLQEHAQLHEAMVQAFLRLAAFDAGP